LREKSGYKKSRGVGVFSDWRCTGRTAKVFKQNIEKTGKRPMENSVGFCHAVIT
jgi:hypothetical protein